MANLFGELPLFLFAGRKEDVLFILLMLKANITIIQKMVVDVNYFVNRYTIKTTKSSFYQQMIGENDSMNSISI